MKYLNKYFPNCPLNKKLRKIYDMKQAINNSKLEKKFKEQMMKACDNEIHMCWELSYRGIEGYEVHIPPELHADSDSICMKVSGGTAYLSV